MAIPSKDQTFALENCYDMLRKLEWEVEGLNRASKDDLDEIAFRAFNCAVTAWQLTDWVWADMNQAQQGAFGSLTNFQNHCRNQCRAIHLCRQIATASKHAEVRAHRDPSVSTVSTAMPTTYISGIPNQSSAEEADTSWHIFIDDGGHRIPAQQILSAAADFWIAFIHSNRIGNP